MGPEGCARVFIFRTRNCFTRCQTFSTVCYESCEWVYDDMFWGLKHSLLVPTRDSWYTTSNCFRFIVVSKSELGLHGSIFGAANAAPPESVHINLAMSRKGMLLVFHIRLLPGKHEVRGVCTPCFFLGSDTGKRSYIRSSIPFISSAPGHLGQMASPSKKQNGIDPSPLGYSIGFCSTVPLPNWPRWRGDLQ